MTVLFQGNFKEQIEKLVRWLLSVGFEKKMLHTKKTMYPAHYDSFVSE
jgi:hypothetical protein